MSMFRRREHTAPGLNTASLPDLIFSVLFFFMIVTHMQKVAVKVQYRTPQGTELTRLTKKTAVTYIYIGKAAGTMGQATHGRTMIQLNDKFGSPCRRDGLCLTRKGQDVTGRPAADDRVDQSRPPHAHGDHHRRKASTASGEGSQDQLFGYTSRKRCV